MFKSDEALCTQFDPDTFFQEAISERDYQTIKKLCNSCPIMQECLSYALEHDVIGIWAGTNYSERKRIRKERGIKPVSLSTQVNAMIKDVHIQPESIQQAKRRQTKKEQI